MNAARTVNYWSSTPCHASVLACSASQSGACKHAPSWYSALHRKASGLLTSQLPGVGSVDLERRRVLSRQRKAHAQAPVHFLALALRSRVVSGAGMLQVPVGCPLSAVSCVCTAVGHSLLPVASDMCKPRAIACFRLTDRCTSLPAVPREASCRSQRGTSRAVRQLEWSPASTGSDWQVQQFISALAVPFCRASQHTSAASSTSEACHRISACKSSKLALSLSLGHQPLAMLLPLGTLSCETVELLQLVAVTGWRLIRARAVGGRTAAQLRFWAAVPCLLCQPCMVHAAWGAHWVHMLQAMACNWSRATCHPTQPTLFNGFALHYLHSTGGIAQCPL